SAIGLCFGLPHGLSRGQTSANQFKFLSGTKFRQVTRLSTESLRAEPHELGCNPLNRQPTQVEPLADEAGREVQRRQDRRRRHGVGGGDRPLVLRKASPE